MEMSEGFDVVVVGAGQAGLVVSYLLKQEHTQHVVLERGNIGESWRSQRWDSFHLNTSSARVALYGYPKTPPISLRISRSICPIPNSASHSLELTQVQGVIRY
jgi:cation diffusion facilitator CzcD-associated flavoprotein CzcO